MTAEYIPMRHEQTVVSPMIQNIGNPKKDAYERGSLRFLLFVRRSFVFGSVFFEVATRVLLVRFLFFLLLSS